MARSLGVLAVVGGLLIGCVTINVPAGPSATGSPSAKPTGCRHGQRGRYSEAFPKPHADAGSHADAHGERCADTDRHSRHIGSAELQPGRSRELRRKHAALQR